MRIIIAGSRDLGGDEYFEIVSEALLDAIRIWEPTVVTEIISGGARGIDTIAEGVAREYAIAFKEFPADWDRHGKRAGYLRNVQMAEAGDALLLVWDGRSKGSKMMKDIAERYRLPIHEVVVE